MNYIGRMVDTMKLNPNVRQSVRYLSEKLVVKVTRRVYRKGRPDKNHFEFLVTIGKPNYAERAFIAMAKKAGEKFPISKVQLKFLKNKGYSDLSVFNDHH